MNTTSNHFPDDGVGDSRGAATTAVGQAGAGATAWRAAARAQQGAVADHRDFYELAGSMVEALTALQDLTRVLARQVRGYAASLPAGQQVYDDTRTFEPQQRLDLAAAEVAGVAWHLGQAVGRANTFWSAIGHIGVEEVDR